MAEIRNPGSKQLKLNINGESREVAAGTVLKLLEELGLHPQGTVVERNREIVDREAYRETPLSEGDAWNWCAWWAADGPGPAPGGL